MYPTTLDHTRVQAPLKFEVVDQPAIEPVPYSDLSDWLKLPSYDDRNLTIALAVAGRQYIEQATRQTLITTTFDLWMDWFPSSILLPARPVQAVTFIQYIDQDGTTQTLDPSRYLVDVKGPRPCIIPPLGAFFPIAKVQTPNAVQVRFTAGFGDDPSDVPQGFKSCIQQWVSLNYNQREGVIMGKTPAIVPYAFQALLNMNSLPEV